MQQHLMRAKSFSTLLVLVLLAGCSGSNTPSHLPRVWDIPGMIGGMGSEAAYQAKRQRVAAYLRTHYAALRSEALAGNGLHVDEALRLAQVLPENHTIMRQTLRYDHAYFFCEMNGLDPLLIELMMGSVPRGQDSSPLTATPPRGCSRNLSLDGVPLPVEFPLNGG